MRSLKDRMKAIQAIDHAEVQSTQTPPTVERSVSPPRSKSKALAAQLMYAALLVLKENGGQRASREVVMEVGQRVALDEWAKEKYPKSGRVRWQSILHFCTIDAVKAGFLVKRRGTWYLTPEGEAALQLGEVELLDAAVDAYKQWKTGQSAVTETALDDDSELDITLEEVQGLAVAGLAKQIAQKNPYEVQELVAALLRSMKYHTPFVTPRGQSGRVEVLASRDALGTVSPRIRVVIKTRLESPATGTELKSLIEQLQIDGDVGLFICTGGFTTDAQNITRRSAVSVELVDLPTFISLWQTFYDEMPAADQKRLPLQPVYFFAE